MNRDALASTRRDFLEASLAGGAVAIGAGAWQAEQPAADKSTQPPKPRIDAYTAAMSILQGQSLPFHISTSVARYAVTISRVGATPTVV